MFYSSALATNPSAWSDFGPYGGGGWVGSDGSDRTQWVLAAAPFFIGAFGVLGLDASVGVQFLMYGKGEEEAWVVVRDGEGEIRWRRVSGRGRGRVGGGAVGGGGGGGVRGVLGVRDRLRGRRCWMVMGRGGEGMVRREVL